MGCGGGQSDTTASSEAIATSAPAETEAQTAESTPATETTEEGTVAETSSDGEVTYAYQANNEPVTLSIYVEDPGTLWESWGQDPVSQRITEQTGISFEAIAPVTSDDTKLSLLISSDDLPDIVTAGYQNPDWEAMIKEGQLADLEEVAREYAPELLNLVDKEVWDYCRSDDGHVYYLLSCWDSTTSRQKFEEYNYLIQSNQPCIDIREDYYEELGSPDNSTPQEFMDFCEQLKEAHPDHDPFYIGGLYGGPSYLSYLFGVGSYYVDENLNVARAYRNPAFLDMYIWLNEMVRKGLISEDSFVDEEADRDNKVAAGSVSSLVFNVAYAGSVPEDNPDSYYYPMKPWNSYEQVRANAGYIRFGISAKSEKKDAAARWLEFGNTKAGAQTMCWGVEGPADGKWEGDYVNGPHFYYEDNGEKATLYPEYMDARLGDWSGAEKQSGIGFYQSYVLTDDWYNVQGQVVDSELMNTMNEWFVPNVRFDDALFFNFPAGSDELVANQTITNLIEEYHVKWAYASSEEEVRSLYDEFLQKCEDAGEETLNAWLTKTYAEQGGSQPTPVR